MRRNFKKTAFPIRFAKLSLRIYFAAFYTVNNHERYLKTIIKTRGSTVCALMCFTNDNLHFLYIRGTGKKIVASLSVLKLLHVTVE